jgi:hypothetical protein
MPSAFTQTDKWQAYIAVIKSKLKHAETEGKISYRSQMGSLGKKQQDSQNKLNEH